MTPRKICVITGTRAEYGILRRLMLRLREAPEVTLQIVATNMHLSPEYGLTAREIEADGFRIDKKIEMLLSSDTPSGTLKSMGLLQIGLADALTELKPDLIVILGDRYEMLAAASAATIFNIPVAHLHGGEVTEGAYDDQIRHAITKLSTWHLTATDDYRRRVIQMGEEPERVFATGALGVDNVLAADLDSPDETGKSIGFDPGRDYIMATYHPVTREPGEGRRQIDSLLEALTPLLGDYKVIFTLPNSDSESRAIRSRIEEWAAAHSDRAAAFTSLGARRYFSLLAGAAAVVGNSSSGIIEAPAFGIPTVDIGNRQKGRSRGNTVIHCGTSLSEISAALDKALGAEFRSFVKREGSNLYRGEGSALDTIFRILTETPLPASGAKRFYDLNNG